MFEKETKGFFAGSIVLIVFGMILNFAFWGGLIYFGFWCLRHFGIL